MELRFGLPVDCADEGCGTLARVVVDPERWEVTHCVVTPSLGDLHARLVPIDLVAAGGDRIRLTCTGAHWHELPYLDEIQRTTAPAEDYWGALLLWPNPVRPPDGHSGRLKGVVIDDRHDASP